MHLSKLILCLATVLIVSCSKPLNEEQYRQFLRNPEHGLVQQASSGPNTVTCAYLPTDLMVLQDLYGLEKDKVTGAIDSVRKNYQGRTYLSLSLARGNSEIENQFLSDQLAYAQSIEYLNSGITEDVIISTPAPDSVRAVAGTYSRGYGATGKSTVLLVFDTQKLDLSQGFTVTFRDTRFNLGTVRFPFTATALRSLPALQLEQPQPAL